MNKVATVDICLRKSHIDFLPQYGALYRTCFPKAIHLNSAYLRWLYNSNPLGGLVGADAWYGDEVVGQVVAVPGEYILNGKLIRGLLAVNVAVHPEFQGRFLFKKLGLKMCEYGAEDGYEFVIGVANKAATPGWVRQMGFQLVQPLEARLGLGNLNLDWNTIVITEQFRHDWSAESLLWRLSNPNRPISSRNLDDQLQCYTPAKGQILPVYGEVPISFKSNTVIGRSVNFISPLRLFLGLIPDGGYQFKRYKTIPERYRPSPLNLIYRSLNQRVQKLEKGCVSFSFLDFDAY